VNRILIIGSYGSGKSTFAKKMHELLKIELIHLDRYFFKQNWVPTSNEEKIIIIKQLVIKEKWIMDGFYPQTFDIRYEYADTVIFLDLPRFLCMWNVLVRLLKTKVTKKRIDGIKHNIYDKFDINFYLRIWTFNRKIKTNFLEKITTKGTDKNIFILKGYKQYKSFLDKLK
jgi:adenylate kinase family enzyme